MAQSSYCLSLDRLQSHAVASTSKSSLLVQHPRQRLCQVQRARRHQQQHRVPRRSSIVTRASLDGVQALITAAKGGGESLAVFLDTAPPPLYLAYLIAAGFGLPCSEDAFVAWVGERMLRGKYGGGAAAVMAIVYVGVVVSDMITFLLGVLLRKGFLGGLREKLLGDEASLGRATAAVQRWGRLVGAVQRVSLGFRGPLCLVAGFSGVPAAQFMAGSAAGALVTMPLQVLAGWLLRGSPNVYAAALALVAGPNLVGHVIGPLATVAAAWWSAASFSTASGARGKAATAPVVEGGGGGSGGGGGAMPRPA